MAIGDHLASVQVLWGAAACANTSKCLFTAAEKGVDIDARAVDINSDSQMDEIRNHSPFGSLPCLKDVDHIVYGTIAIMSYLDDKGFGPSLVPRNGVKRAEHYKWIYIANDIFGPAVEQMITSSANGNAERVEQTAKAAIMLLEGKLSSNRKGEYIVDEFSMADIHWVSYIHQCLLHEKHALIQEHPYINKWLDLMKTRKSSSKENYVAYTVLPSLSEFTNNQIRSIHINV